MSVPREKYDNLKEKAERFYEELKDIKKELKKIYKENYAMESNHKKELEKLNDLHEKELYKMQDKYERQILEKNQDIRILERDVENYKERLKEIREDIRSSRTNREKV